MKKLLCESAFRILGAVLRASGAQNSCLFVLGAMRSGNTLFSHILFTNPRIVGIGEAWRTYTQPADLDRLVAKLLCFRRTWLHANHYFQDTILHNHLLPDPDFLTNPRIIPIFLLREPGSVLESLFRAQFPGFESWDQITAYYVSRHAHLVQCARKTKGRRLVIRYEDLVDFPAATLLTLQNSLNLPEPFSPNYPVFEFTGRRTGDQSPYIRAGKIIGRRTIEPVAVPTPTLRECTMAYQSLTNELSASPDPP
jgi:hypothetical protein